MRSRDCGVRSGLWKAFGSMAALWESLRALEKGLAMDWMWGIGGGSLRVTASMWLDGGQSVWLLNETALEE